MKPFSFVQYALAAQQCKEVEYLQNLVHTAVFLQPLLSAHVK